MDEKSCTFWGTNFHHWHMMEDDLNETFEGKNLNWRA